MFYLIIVTPTLGGPAEELVRARVVDAVLDLLPYRPVVLHLGVLPFVADAVRVRVVFDHGSRVHGDDHSPLDCYTPTCTSADRVDGWYRTRGACCPVTRRTTKAICCRWSGAENASAVLFETENRSAASGTPRSCCATDAVAAATVLTGLRNARRSAFAGPVKMVSAVTVGRRRRRRRLRQRSMTGARVINIHMRRE